VSPTQATGGARGSADAPWSAPVVSYSKLYGGLPAIQLRASAVTWFGRSSLSSQNFHGSGGCPPCLVSKVVELLSRLGHQQQRLQLWASSRLFHRRSRRHNSTTIFANFSSLELRRPRREEGIPVGQLPGDRGVVVFLLLGPEDLEKSRSIDAGGGGGWVA
jgi:hypothetical protein